MRAFLARGLAFALVGAALYGAVYAAAERLVYRQAHRNRFFVIRSAPAGHYDYVLLGASHAAALDYQDMTRRLEQMTGARILNLAVVGGGISVNRLLLEYFLTRHTAGAVVYVVDSFAFYSRAWNEDRLRDSRLFERAPLDARLAALLLREPATRGVALDYISGFSKINNPNRFAPDLFADETTRFERVYRPVPQIDRQRIEYLYPSSADPEMLRTYLAEFEALVQLARSRGIHFLIVRPPIPARVAAMLPGEERFDAALRDLAARNMAPYHDFAGVNNDEQLFYDTDHLNRSGVLSFFEHHLAGVLTPPRGQSTGR